MRVLTGIINETTAYCAVVSLCYFPSVIADTSFCHCERSEAISALDLGCRIQNFVWIKLRLLRSFHSLAVTRGIRHCVIYKVKIPVFTGMTMGASGHDKRGECHSVPFVCHSAGLLCHRCLLFVCHYIALFFLSSCPLFVIPCLTRNLSIKSGFPFSRA